MWTEGNPDVDGSDRYRPVVDVNPRLRVVGAALAAREYDVWGPLFGVEVQERLGKLGLLPADRSSYGAAERIARTVGYARRSRARQGRHVHGHLPPGL